MPRRPVVIVLSIAAAAVIGYVLWDRPHANEAPPQAPAEGRKAPAPRRAVEPVSAILPAPEPSRQQVEGYIAYPDGTFLPPLNGVKVAPKIMFHPRQAPFSKVVGKERDVTGREWYVHENGARSTTYIDAQGVAQGLVQMPAPVMPIPADEVGKEPQPVAR